MTSAAANLTTIAAEPIVFGEPLPNGHLALIARLAAFALVVFAASFVPPPVKAAEVLASGAEASDVTPV